MAKREYNRQEIEKDTLAAAKQKFLEVRGDSQDRDIDSRSEVYSIDSEFAKSKKNIPVFFHLVFFGFLALLVGGTFFLTSILNQNYEASLGLDTYRDVRLKELLEKSRDAQTQLANAQKEVTFLKEELNREIIILQENSLEELKKINEQNIPSVKRNKQTQLREALLQQGIDTLKKEYKVKVKEVKLRIAQLKQELANRKESVDQGVSQTKQIIDNYRHLQNLKLNKQLAEFNPVFKKAALRKSLSEKNKFKPSAYPEIINYANAFSEERVVAKAPFEGRLRDIKKRDKLMRRVLEIPYLNSVPIALQRIHSLNKSINENYERLWYKLYLNLRDRDQSIRERERMIKERDLLLASYRYALASLASREGEVGYILDPRQSQRMLVQLGTIFRPEKGAASYVFREAKEYIAQVKLFPIGQAYDLYTAQLLDKDKRIKPFDRLVLVDKRSEVNIQQQSQQKSDPKSNKSNKPDKSDKPNEPQKASEKGEKSEKRQVENK